MARHHHAHALSEFVVHTLVAAERRGIRMVNFYRENTLRLDVLMYMGRPCSPIAPSNCSTLFGVSATSSPSSTTGPSVSAPSGTATVGSGRSTSMTNYRIAATRIASASSSPPRGAATGSGTSSTRPPVTQPILTARSFAASTCPITLRSVTQCAAPVFGTTEDFRRPLSRHVRHTDSCCPATITDSRLHGRNRSHPGGIFWFIRLKRTWFGGCRGS